jgi:hypothetical protein
MNEKLIKAINNLYLKKCDEFKEHKEELIKQPKST